jgi:transposase-like protein
MKARPKKSKKSDVNASKGKRYSADERAKILAVVHEVNAERGRGGVTAAAAKFGVSPLTISHWLRNVGILGTPGARRRTAGDSGVFRELADLHDKITVKQKELSQLESQFKKLKGKL